VSAGMIFVPWEGVLGFGLPIAFGSWEFGSTGCAARTRPDPGRDGNGALGAGDGVADAEVVGA
jgi:hypothetical protein